MPCEKPTAQWGQFRAARCFTHDVEWVLRFTFYVFARVQIRRDFDFPVHRSGAGEGGGFVRENREDLVEPRDAENGPDVFPQSEEREFSTVGSGPLHGLDEHGEAGAINIADTREIDED